jgi:hypothetical protein
LRCPTREHRPGGRTISVVGPGGGGGGFQGHPVAVEVAIANLAFSVFVALGIGHDYILYKGRKKFQRNCDNNQKSATLSSRFCFTIVGTTVGRGPLLEFYTKLHARTVSCLFEYEANRRRHSYSTSTYEDSDVSHFSLLSRSSFLFDDCLGTRGTRTFPHSWNKNGSKTLMVANDRGCGWMSLFVDSLSCLAFFPRLETCVFLMQ